MTNLYWRSGARWEKWEDEIISARLEGGQGLAPIALKLGRSPGSCRVRRATLRERSEQKPADALPAPKKAEAKKLRQANYERLLDEHRRPEPVREPDPRDLPAKRGCLKCRKAFDSAHAGNRLCPRCTTKVNKASGGYDAALPSSTTDLNPYQQGD